MAASDIVWCSSPSSSAILAALKTGRAAAACRLRASNSFRCTQRVRSEPPICKRLLQKYKTQGSIAAGLSFFQSRSPSPNVLLRCCCAFTAGLQEEGPSTEHSPDWHNSSLFAVLFDGGRDLTVVPAHFCVNMWEVARGVSHPWRRTSNAVGVAATAGAGGGAGGGAGVTAGDIERQQDRRQHQSARDLDRDRNHRRSHGLARQASRSGSRKRDKVREERRRLQLLVQVGVQLAG